MKEHKIEPLDLMQFINTKYHEPFIHEVIELEEEIDINRLKDSVDKLVEVFPLLNCYYDKNSNKYIEQDIVDLVFVAKIVNMNHWLQKY